MTIDPHNPNLGHHNADDAPATIVLALSSERLAGTWSRILRKSGCSVCVTATADDLAAVLAQGGVDVLMIDDEFDSEALIDPAWQGSLVAVLSTLSVEHVIAAMQRGAVDALAVDAEEQRLTQAVAHALARSSEQQARADRMHALDATCQRLDAACTDSHRQVEVLCRDLAAAYEDIAEQLTETAMAAEFRTLLSQELDIENLLRTSLEYLLSRIGPTNAAVFLPDQDRHYSLGAYVNYSCPREEIEVVLEYLSQSLCPLLESQPEIVAFDCASNFAQYIDADVSFLEGSEVIAFRCSDGKETLATMILFRDQDEPFGLDVVPVIDTLRFIFASQVARVIRIHHRATPQWPHEAAEDTFDADEDYGFGLAA
ncbi:MAG: hypothetical protein ACR2GY_03290 [Phycisphaerales bacterium]